MPNKSVLLTVAAIALMFGLVFSGCNRDNRVAMKNDRGSSVRNQGLRPAEVLSASAYRSPLRMVYETPAMVSQSPQYPGYPQHQHTQPPPESAPVQYIQARQTSTEPYFDQPQLASAYVLRSTSEPVPVPSQPQYQHSWPMQPTPDLVMARASFPEAVPTRSVVAVPVVYSRAPIPELEPMRFQSLPAERGAVRPVAEIMVSSDAGQPDRQEIQRALAPLADSVAPVDPRRGWVASPATAMRGGW